MKYKTDSALFKYLYGEIINQETLDSLSEADRKSFIAIPDTDEPERVEPERLG